MYKRTSPHFSENRQYVYSILKIILLTNVPAVFMLFSVPKSSIGWMAGSLASAVNFWFLAQKVMHISPKTNTKSGAMNSVSKVFILRFMVLVAWAVFVMLVLKPDLVTFCIGLLATQFAIFIHHVYILLTQGPLKKYFSSEDEPEEEAYIKETKEDEKKEKN